MTKTLIVGNVFRIEINPEYVIVHGKYLGQSPEWPYTLNFQEVQAEFNGWDGVDVYTVPSGRIFRIPPESTEIDLQFLAGKTETLS